MAGLSNFQSIAPRKRLGFLRFPNGIYETGESEFMRLKEIVGGIESQTLVLVDLIKTAGAKRKPTARERPCHERQ
jgi:hypothetical protein